AVAWALLLTNLWLMPARWIRQPQKRPRVSSAPAMPLIRQLLLSLTPPVLFLPQRKKRLAWFVVQPNWLMPTRKLASARLRLSPARLWVLLTFSWDRKTSAQIWRIAG